MPIAGLGLVIWATKSNGGVSSRAVETAEAASSTTVYAFAVMSQFNSGTSSADDPILILWLTQVRLIVASSHGQQFRYAKF